MSGEDPLHGPIAELHHGGRILRTEPNSVGSHTEQTPAGAALLVGRLELVGCILRTAHPLAHRETQGRCAPLTMLITP